MNLSLSKLPWYGQVGAFLALSLAAAGVFWNWYARPTQASITEREATLATLRADINRGLATARRLPEFRKELAELEAQLDRLRAVLPDERDVGDLLRRVQGMATQSNLTILGFTPQAVATPRAPGARPHTLRPYAKQITLGSPAQDRINSAEHWG